MISLHQDSQAVYLNKKFIIPIANLEELGKRSRMNSHCQYEKKFDITTKLIGDYLKKQISTSVKRAGVLSPQPERQLEALLPRADEQYSTVKPKPSKIDESRLRIQNTIK